MSETPARATKNKLAKIYGAGILAFIAIFGSLTVLASFLARLK